MAFLDYLMRKGNEGRAHVSNAIDKYGAIQDEGWDNYITKNEGFFGGKPERMDQIQNFTEDQQSSMGQMLKGGTQQLPQIFEFLQNILSQDPDTMKQFQAPAMRQFNEEIIPGIAEKFTQLGAQGSSAFTQSLGQAGAGLEERLSSQRAGLGGDSIKQLMSILSSGLTPQFTNLHRPEEAGMGEKVMDTLIKILPLLLAA